MQPKRVALVPGSDAKRVGSVADALAKRGCAIAVHYRGSAGAEDTAAFAER